MWILFCLFVVVVLTQGLPFPSTVLEDCPNIPAQNNIRIKQILGSWRLAYLFVDNPEDLDEDDSCVVTELGQVNETTLDLLLLIDSRKSDHILERSTTQLLVTLLTPGEWAVHTSLADQEYIHATVISLSDHHMILTFCGTQVLKPDEEETGIANVEPADSKRIERDDRLGMIFGNEESNRVHDEFDLGGYDRPVLDPRRRRLARRNERDLDNEIPDLDFEKYDESLRKYLDASRRPKSEKHLWTAILVKNNNVSALKFVKYASLLMKHGYDVTKGQLISFGKCVG